MSQSFHLNLTSLMRELNGTTHIYKLSFWKKDGMWKGGAGKLMGPFVWSHCHSFSCLPMQLNCGCWPSFASFFIFLNCRGFFLHSCKHCRLCKESLYSHGTFRTKHASVPWAENLTAEFQWNSHYCEKDCSIFSKSLCLHWWVNKETCAVLNTI